MLSWNHLCWQAGPGLCSDPLPAAAATQQSCDTRTWLCLSALCSAGQWCGTEVTQAWAIFGICPWQLSPGHYLKPFFSLLPPWRGTFRAVSSKCRSELLCRATEPCDLVPEACLGCHAGEPGLTEPALPLGTPQLRPEGPQRSIQPHIPPSAGAMSSHPQERTGQVCDACLLFPLPAGTCSWASWLKAGEVCSLATSICFHLVPSNFTCGL